MLVIIDYLARQSYEKLTIVAPDGGGAERARAATPKRLDAQLAVIQQAPRRRRQGRSHERYRRSRRPDVIADDIIDTAGTIKNAAEALKANGAEALACAIHGVCGLAIDRIEKSPIEGP